MGLIRAHPPELLVIAVFSRHDEALQWAEEQLTAAFGPISFTSPPFDFVQTTYYHAEMGTNLRKLFHVFRDLVPTEELPVIKLHTNQLEEALAASGRFPEERPINLDPGMLSLGKFMLATTKDQAHRIYLRDGILAEVTLRFQDGEFQPWPWTYADYRLPEVGAFLKKARDYYRTRLHD